MYTLQFASSLYLIISGLWFLNPYSGAFLNASPTGAYHFISELMPQGIWAFLLLAFGLANIIAILQDRFRYQKIISLLTVFFWVWVSVLFASANIYAWVFLNTIFLSMLHVWIYLRVSRQHRIRQEVREEVAAIIETHHA
jgi:hypothetical protein